MTENKAKVRINLMPKGTLKKVIGVIICLAVFFIVFNRPIYAFDFFGLLKPKKQEVYQAGGSFTPDAYIARLKVPLEQKVLSMRGRFVRVDCLSLSNNKVSIAVSEEGDVTGKGKIGRISCSWYKTDEDGIYKALWMDWEFQFTFSGKAKGDNLEGQVRVVGYAWQKEWEKKTSDQPASWSAKKEGNTITGNITGMKDGNLAFSATVGKVIEVELSPAPELTPLPSPSPSPTPGEKRKLKLLNLEGKPLVNGEARIRLKDGTFKDVKVKNGEIVYDSGLAKQITVKDLDDPKNKKLTLQIDDLEQEKAIIASREEWLNQIMPKLEALAKILNDGQEIDLNKLFEINPNADEDEYQPRWLAKDEISFNSGQMAWTSDVNTPIHEILGHALTEAVGKGNKITYGGSGAHDDPWQPAYKERSILNPARWFGGKTAALSEDKAKGMALSEGWAQYVGDKWDRELKNIPDEKSELTTANAQKEIVNRKDRTYGKLYDEKGYGAKVENVVATVFNEIYKGKSLEETVADFAAVRKEFKRIHNGKSFQTIGQFIYQKIEMIEDGPKKQRIKDLIKDLVLE